MSDNDKQIYCLDSANQTAKRHNAEEEALLHRTGA